MSHASIIDGGQSMLMTHTLTGHRPAAGEQDAIELRPLRWVYAILAVALCYWLLAVLADYLTYPGSVTAIWPASGLAAAAAIVFGYKIWPGILLGVYLNQMSWFVRSLDDMNSALFWSEFSNQSLVGLSYAAGNCLEVMLIVYLVRRYAASRNPLSTTSDVIRFIVLAALAAPLVGSLSGTLITCWLWGWTPWSAFWSTLWTWWVSAAAGILVVTPALLFLFYETPKHWSLSLNKMLEGACLICVASLIVFVTFYCNFSFEYLLLPTLLWAAFRFNQFVTSWLGGALMLVSIYATTQGLGPFAADASDPVRITQALTLLQCFTVTLIGTAMVVAATVADRRRVAQELIHSNNSLEQRVMQRTCELERLADEARRANQAKSRFLATASHDLHQPLHALRYLVESMMREIGDKHPDSTQLSENRAAHTTKAQIHTGSMNTNPQHLQKVTNKMHGAIENMRGLFDSILDISRLDANAVKPQLETFQITDVVGTIQQEFSGLVQSRGLEWQCSCEAACIQSDPALLERILRNLLDNALKFTDNGSISLTVTRSQTGLKLSVSDTGSGIPLDRQQDIFDEFYQLEVIAGPRTHGLGLGLSIVRQLCQLLDHDLVLQSVPGEGTTVMLSLEEAVSKQTRYTKRSSGDDQQADLPAYASENTNTVVLIEDSSTTDVTTLSLVQKWGYVARRLYIDDPHIGKSCRSLQASVLLVESTLLERLNGGQQQLMRQLLASHVSQVVAIGESTAAKAIGANYCISDPVKPAQLRSALRACTRELQAVDKST